MFSMRATIYSTSRATPAQLVFGRVAMLTFQHEADWAYIKEHRDKISLKNNKQENATCRKHEYKLYDKVLLKMQAKLKYGTNVYTRPFKIVHINDNGTVNCVTDTYNLRNIKPYYD